MNIHEHQAKALLAGFGVAVPRGKPAFSVDEAVAAATELGGPVYVVKAQIHAGGRGKAGGVKVVSSTDEVASVATELLGKTLVTHQTGPQGREVKRLYIEGGMRYRRRAVSVASGRPWQQPRDHHRLQRGRHGHRGSRRHAA